MSTYQEAFFAFDSFLSLWLIALIVIAALLVIGFSMLRSWGKFPFAKMLTLGGLQLAMFGLLIMLLMQPVLVTERLVQEENRILLLLDASQSMAYGNDDRPRIQQALEAFNSEPIEQLANSYPVDRHVFAETPQKLANFEELPAPEPRTHLGSSLISLLQQAASQSVGAVILATDGVDTQSESGALSAEQLAEIAAYGIPIHSIGFGRTEIDEDLEIASLQISDAALPNTLVQADLSIRHDAGGQARIKVYEGERFITSSEVALEGNAGVTNAAIEFDIGEQGYKQLEFVLDPLEGERNLDNNRLSKLVNVAGERHRVLYVEGEPRWEYKFIRRALEEDNTLDLHTLLWVSDNKYYRQGIETPEQLNEGFPATRDELFSYDAVIIGSVAAPRFTSEQQSMLYDFVNERGGSLLMLGGRHGLSEGSWGNSQVGQLLPARLKDREQGYVRERKTVQITASGVDSALLKFTEDEDANNQLWTELPPLNDYQLLGSLRPAANTLLSLDSGEPLLVSQPYGKGTASIFATGGTWRWQMSLPSDDNRHHTFWRQLARSLVIDSENRFELQVDVQPGHVQLRAQVSDEDYQAMDDIRVMALVAPAERSNEQDDNEMGIQTLELQPVSGEPGVYRTEFSSDGHGAFYVDAIASRDDTPLDSTRAAFEIPEDRAEFFNIRQNRAQLERLSEMTGGQYWEPGNLDGLPLAISRSKAGITEQNRDPLWSLPIVFLLLIGLKSSEWLLRRRWGRI